MTDSWAPPSDQEDLGVFCSENDDDPVESVEEMLSSTVPGESAPLVGHAPAQQHQTKQPAEKKKPRCLNQRGQAP